MSLDHSSGVLYLLNNNLTIDAFILDLEILTSMDLNLLNLLKNNSNALKILVTRLNGVINNNSFLNTKNKSSTIIATFDRDVEENRSIVYELESLGVGVLSLAEVDNEISFEGLYKTLHSLKLNKIVHIDSENIHFSLGGA